MAIGAKGTHTNHNYFTAMAWRPDSRRLCVHTNLNHSKLPSGYAWFDVETGESEVILDSPCLGAVVSTDDQVFYIAEGGREIRAIDIPSGRGRLINRLEDGYRARGVLSVTHDVLAMGVNIYNDDRNGAGLINVKTGKLEHLIDPKFPLPSTAGHTMVNPVHKHLLYYCHESMENIHRLWLADLNTGESRNIYRQKRLDDGTVVEYVGHELWKFDGTGMYFVKYKRSPLKPTGIYYTDTLHTEGEFINGDYYYWHVAISPDGKYAVADTKEDDWRSKIVLIDIATRQSRLLCEAPCWDNHPGHPHPSFSPDSRKISFTFADDNNELQVGVIWIG